MKSHERVLSLVVSMALAFGLAGCLHRPTTYERPDLIARVNGENLPRGTDRRSASSDGSIVRASAEEATKDAEGREPIPDAGPGVAAEARSAAGIEAGGEKPKEGEAEAEALAEPLTLERARELAMRYSPILRGSVAAVDSSLGDLEVVQSGFKPTFLGNYAYQAFTSDVGFVGDRGRFPVLPVRGFGPGMQNFHISEVQMKWSIYQFGRLLSKERQARFKTEVAKLEADRSQQTVGYEVARTYFQVLEAESTRRIADRAVDRAEAYRREAGDLLRRGAITREQLLRVDADLAGARQLQSDAKSEEEVAVAALNQTMGIKVDAPTRVAERRAAPRLEMELKDALELSVASRPEIPVVLRGIAIAQEGVSFARAEFLPIVSIQAGYSNVTGTGIQNANVGAGGIFLTQELYAGGKRRGQLRSAEAGVRSAEAQAQQVCDLIAFEVNAAYRYLEDAHARIEAARAVYLQAVENQRLVASRYEAGDATPAEVVEARASETKSEQTFNAAFYQYQRALARLEYAVGGPLPVSAEPIPAAAPVETGPDRAPAPPPASRRSAPAPAAASPASPTRPRSPCRRPSRPPRPPRRRAPRAAPSPPASPACSGRRRRSPGRPTSRTRPTGPGPEPEGGAGRAHPRRGPGAWGGRGSRSQARTSAPSITRAIIWSTD
ncbi:TolC family protein [Planctomyces sp. SH-PL62]|uniref:TolC family protein n=1 Tax=Planctomyces sp. SH-PL62 TaxID=1636152 RepID=UPI00078CBA86|nr:TolC family protein [Planctomyces sp. SH-PL62]AMV38158.1 outer membrane channel protein [Planctomyces sp. SH-PL62]